MFLTLDFKMEKTVLFGIPFWFVFKCFDTQQKCMLAKSDLPVTRLTFTFVGSLSFPGHPGEISFVLLKQGWASLEIPQPSVKDFSLLYSSPGTK